jgi:hypothetical protein
MQALSLGSPFVLAAALLVPALAPAQNTQPQPAPIPPAILSAKTIFLANGGADAGLFPHPFSGSASRGYNEFYAALHSSGRYQFVSSPEQADLVLEFRLLAPLGPTTPNKQEGAPDPLPAVSVRIYDRPTHYVLWAFSESVALALLQQTHDRNLDEAITRLAKDVEDLTSPKPATP